LRIKELFTVPKDEKITEKAFARVLLSSVCSILLCMTCLAGTTWAWFTVSVENTGNVIQIGTAQANAAIVSVDGEEVPEGVAVFAGADDEETDAGMPLPAGTYVFKITHANDYDDLNAKSTLYVTLTATGTNTSEETAEGEATGGEVTTGKNSCVYGYVVLNGDNHYETTVTIQVAEDCTLSMEVSWFAPANANSLEDEDGNNILVYSVVDNTPGTTDEGSEGTTDESTESSGEASDEPVEGAGDEPDEPGDGAGDEADDGSGEASGDSEEGTGDEADDVSGDESDDEANDGAGDSSSDGSGESVNGSGGKTTESNGEPTTATTETTEAEETTPATSAPTEETTEESSDSDIASVVESGESETEESTTAAAEETTAPAA